MNTPELDALRAEVEHWKAHAEEAGAGFTQVCKDAARLAARNSELVRRIEAVAAILDDYAPIARVQRGCADTCGCTDCDMVQDLRAALTSPPGQADRP